MNGLEFFARADVEQAGVGIFNGLSGIERIYENLLVCLVGFPDPRDGLIRIDAFISGTDTFECFIRLKAATGTSANMVMTEERALRSGALLEQVPHGGLWRYRHEIAG